MGLARVALISLLLGLCALTVQAAAIDTFTLDQIGWQISGSTAYEIGITIDAAGTDTDGRKWAALEISKKFRYGPDSQTGVIPSIVMDFTQIADDANTATRLFIADESITNLTGEDWHDYYWILMRHGVATFNQTLTNVGDPNGFSVAPFTQFQWTVNNALDNEELKVSGGGTVPAGSIFLPGDGPGNLVIDIVPAGPRPMSFTFKQYPTPEPASMAFLLLGTVTMLRRRRR